MKKIILLFAVSLFVFNSFSQDCGVYHPTTIGSKLIYTYYEKPNKPDKTCEMTIKNKENTAKGLKLDVDGVVKEKNGKEALSYSYSAWCDGETFIIDMKNMMASVNAGDLSSYKIESTNLQFPKNLAVGQALPDGTLTLSLDGPVKAGITVNVTNRKVEAFESVTTSAGTFDCVKISSDVNSKIVFAKTSSKTIEWFSINVGMVKTETYDAKGKLLGTNILTSMK